MPPKKRMRFDPDAAKANARRKKDSQDAMEEMKAKALAFV